MGELDGMTMDEKIIVEIKCPGKEDYQTALDGKVPQKYWPQVQQQMIVTNIDSMYYFSYRNENDMVVVQVLRDEEYCQELVKKTERFWLCVKNGVLSDEFKDKKRICKKNKSFEWQNTMENWTEAKRNKELYEEREQCFKRQLIELCGDFDCEGFGIKVSKHDRLGAIQYDKIKELKSVDLEKYRKPSSEYWSIREC